MADGGAARRNAPSEVLSPASTARTESWILSATTWPAETAEADSDELLLLLGVPDGAFDTCRRGARWLVLVGGEPAAPVPADQRFLAELGLARWAPDDDTMITPRADRLRATISADRAQIFLSDLPWVGRPIAVPDEALWRDRRTCLFGVYFLTVGQAPAPDAGSAFYEQLLEGRAAVAEIGLTGL